MNIKTGKQICPCLANISDKYVCPQCNNKMQIVRTDTYAYYRHVFKPKKCTYKFKNKIISATETEKNFTQEDVAWIKQSNLYLSLIDDEEDNNDVNILEYDKLSKNTIDTPDDANAILETVQYWGVHPIPQSILQYFAVNDIKKMELTFNLEPTTYNILSNLKSLFNILCNNQFSQNDRTVFLTQAHRRTKYKNCVRLDVFEFLMNHDRFQINYDIFMQKPYRRQIIQYFAEWAAYHGQIDCLKYAFERGCKMMYAPVHAAVGGFLDCLKFSCENGGIFYARSSCENAAVQAIKCGSLDCLKYVVNNGCDINLIDLMTCFYYAIQCGQVECLQYMHEYYLKNKTCSYNANYYFWSSRWQFSFAKTMLSYGNNNLPFWTCVINPSRTLPTNRKMALNYAIKANIIAVHNKYKPNI